MASLDIINTLKEEAVIKLGEMEAVKAKIQARIESLDLLAIELAAEMKQASEQGFEEGLRTAGQANGTDKIYSDSEMNQYLADREAAVRAELQPQIDSLSARIAMLEAEVAATPAKIDNAVAAFKAELKAKLDEQQAAESAGEVSILNLLA